MLLSSLQDSGVVCLRRAIHFARKGTKAGSFAFDYGAEDNDTLVARHNCALPGFVDSKNEEKTE